MLEMTTAAMSQFTSHNSNSCFITALPAIIYNGHGRPPDIEAASTKFSFAVAVNDDSSASNADDPPNKWFRFQMVPDQCGLIFNTEQY